VSDLFGKAGRHWLSRQALPVDERSTVVALLRQLDFQVTSSPWSTASWRSRRCTIRLWPG
jgi:hypothetical protein